MLDVAPIRRVATHQHDVADSLVSSSTPCGGYPGHQWFVVQSHPQAERWALQNLQRIGYTAWLPLISVQRRDPVLRSLTRQVEVPLFSSYLFVSFNAAHDPWTPIWHTPGVKQLLTKDGGKPNPLSDAAVSLLQAVVAAGQHNVPENARLVPGASVAVVNGLFKGCEGVVLSVRRRSSAVLQSAVVLLMMFGALREVRVPLAHLVAR